MATLASIQGKLATKVFSKLGSSAVFSSLVSSTTDKWGDKSITYDAGTTVTVVPFNMVSKDLEYLPFGNIQFGDVAMVAPYGAVFDETYKVVYDSTTYFIKQIEKFPYSDGNLAYAILLSEDK